MMMNFDGYILLRGLVIGDTIQITRYNGLPTHVFKKLLSKLGNESIFTNKTVSIGMDKATFRQEVEILANVKYKNIIPKFMIFLLFFTSLEVLSVYLV